MLGLSVGLNTGVNTRRAQFSPLDLPNLVGWWDASDTSTITESSGDVSQIDDKSGNGLHLVQPTSAYQPTTGTQTLNGKNVLSFADTGYMQSSTTLALGSNHLLMVWQHVSGDFLIWGTESGIRWFWPGDFGNSSSTIISGCSTTEIRNNGALVTGVSTRDDVWNVFDSQVNLTSAKVNWLNESRNVAPLSYPPNPAAINGPRYLAEAVMYGRHLSSDETGQVEAYLASKWGVTLP